MNKTLKFWPTKMAMQYLSGKCGGGFVFFLTSLSIIGISLGVASLIAVMSVMNGFQKEITNKLTSGTSHIEVSKLYGDENYNDTITSISNIKKIKGISEYTNNQGLINSDGITTGVFIRGVNPKTDIKTAKIIEVDNLISGKFNIVIGKRLADNLHLKKGDQVVVMATENMKFSPTGVVPKFKKMTISGIFETGVFDIDSGLTIIHIEDSYKIFNKYEPDGLRLLVSEPLYVEDIVNQISNKVSKNFIISTWKDKFKAILKAIQIEKATMFIILSFIVTIAAFNIISGGMMLAFVKKGDIAILRSIGATKTDILQLYISIGIIIGFIGAIIGVVLGYIISYNLPSILSALEYILSVKIIDPEVYMLSEVPSEIHTSDVLLSFGLAFFLSSLASIVPAYKAAKTEPSKELRYG